jgi:hypothetical protein
MDILNGESRFFVDGWAIVFMVRWVIGRSRFVVSGWTIAFFVDGWAIAF